MMFYDGAHTWEKSNHSDCEFWSQNAIVYIDKRCRKDDLLNGEHL